MTKIQVIFTSKFKLVIYAVVCLSISCSSLDVAQTSPKNTIAENSNRAVNRKISEPAQNLINSSEEKIKPTETEDNTLKSPSQTKARRSSINFPDGCDFYTVDKKFMLERSCAFAINNVLADLPKQGCGYDSFLARGTISNGSGFMYLVEYATDYHPGAIKFYPLSSNKYLVEVYCNSGAYNTENAYLFYDESSIPAKASVLEFPSLEFTYDEDSDVAKDVKKVSVQTVGGRYFDSENKELIVFVKASGIGNAGRYARYSFPIGKPKLLEFRAKFKWEGIEYETDKIMKKPPKTWKRYYP